VIEDAVKLKETFTSINEMFDEITFELTPEGIKILANDRASVVLLDLLIKKGMFKEYECDKESVKIALNMQEFYLALKRFTGETTLSLEAEHTFVFSQSLPLRKILKVSLYETDYKKDEELRELAKHKITDFKARIELKSSVLETIIKESEKCREMMLDVNEQRLRLTGNTDITKYDYRLEMGNEFLIKLDVTQPCQTVINNDYFQRLIKSTPISDVVRIEMGMDYPLRMSYVNPNVMLIYLVAPTVGYEKEPVTSQEEPEGKRKIISQTEKKTIIEDGD
jgi:DNA polymerase III sliding clamp (beta) subunit (PCNA family)